MLRMTSPYPAAGSGIDERHGHGRSRRLILIERHVGGRDQHTDLPGWPLCSADHVNYAITDA
jgi:hypothetical protein